MISDLVVSTVKYFDLKRLVIFNASWHSSHPQISWVWHKSFSVIYELYKSRWLHNAELTVLSFLTPSCQMSPSSSSSIWENLEKDMHYFFYSYASTEIFLWHPPSGKYQSSILNKQSYFIVIGTFYLLK